ncbi:hypothetical protein PENTCL1PPCAC_14744 [Pristionchus entomophagus]|uniref:Nuclear receptor n=1 Tax=Pristionchus entomophagus TaxID=358040 RepID=A0AAV5TB81_9BILA|nr:hypothetical protein PENTCL1PPCAC_14744 [Pristionchus entomophagus]
MVLCIPVVFNQMECLICTEPITYAHLGVNSCRACAMFYKRSTESKKPLKCKGGADDCRKLDPKSTCRLCRFTRFNEILKQAASDSESMASTVKLSFDGEERKESFISHESYFDSEPSTSHTPLLDRLRKGYSLMCLIRHAGERGTLSSKREEQTEIRVGNLVLFPAKYSLVPTHAKICVEAMHAFASHAFDDFREFDEENRNLIIRTAHFVMNALDSAYRVAHHFPNETDTRTPGYTTYLRMSDLERFVADCPDKFDSAKIIRQLQEFVNISVDGVRKYFKLIKPTDYEFIALFGLALWNPEIANLNEDLLRMAMRNRARIMNELHEYYARQGKLDYALRIGQLYCVLIYFQNNNFKVCEDFQLFRLQGIFTDYSDKNGN